MNDAEYQNNSLILPEDDLDEENFNNFIHSNQS